MNLFRTGLAVTLIALAGAADADEAPLSGHTERGSPTLEFGHGLIPFQPTTGTSRQVADIDLRGFLEVGELAPELPPIDYRDGGQDVPVRKLDGLKKETSIQLEIPVSKRTMDLEGFLERYRD